jgi:hypothetical protein
VPRGLEVVDLRTIQDLSYQTADTGIPDRIKERYDEALRGAGKKLWQGWLQVATSGFGKGLIIAALGAIAVSAAIVGFQAYAGVLAIGGVAATVEQGLALGVTNAIEFLASGFGLAWMGIGGTIGAVADTRKAQNKITAAEAEIEARQLELMRRKGQQQQPEFALPTPQTPQHLNGADPQIMAEVPANGERCLASGESFNYCAREATRRAEAEKSGLGFTIT